MNKWLLSFLLLGTAIAPGALTCDTDKLKSANEIFQINIMYLIKKNQDNYFEITNCEYKTLSQAGSMKIEVKLKTVKCTFQFLVLVFSGYSLKPGHSLPKQAQACDDIIEAGASIAPIVNKSIPEKVLPMIFNEEHEKEAAKQSLLKEIEKAGGVDKQIELVNKLEDEIDKAMTQLLKDHELNENGEYNYFFNRNEEEGQIGVRKVVPKRRVPTGSASLLGQQTPTEDQKSPLEGGWGECSPSQKQRYLLDVLREADMNGDAFSVSDVTKCSVQVVAGLNVKITFGKSEEELCHYHIFYPLNNGLPLFQARKALCLPEAKRTPLVIGAPSAPSDCTINLTRMALNVLREKAANTNLEYATEENVIKCTQQFADGTKIRLMLSFDGQRCEFFSFMTPTGQFVSSRISNCVAH